MKRIILTTSDSGAGCLRASQIADQVVGFTHRLVCGPVPPISEPAAFFAARANLFGAEVNDWRLDACGSTIGREWDDLIIKCKDFERIEIWVDPVPDAQLLLAQFLDWFSRHPDLLGRLVLVHADTPIGDREPEEIALLRPHFQKVVEGPLETGTAALRAFQQPTPEASFALLREDLRPLPHLRQAILRLLEELPAAGTALTRTEGGLLKLVSRGETGPLRVIADVAASGASPVLDYWELGQTLDQLARCREPAILGLGDGPFTMELHDDHLRFQRYKRSSLRLSPLGQDLVENRADFSRHNVIDRWWGGTEVTNDHLWRWDAVNNVLVPPP